MKQRVLAAALAAMIVVASGIVGSFYFAGAQVQDLSTQDPQVRLDNPDQITSGSAQVSGTDFRNNSEVSLYLLSAVQANMTGSTWLVLQESRNQTAEQAKSQGNIFDNAIGTLKNLLKMNDGQQPAGSGQLILFAGANPGRATAVVECDNQEIANVALQNGSRLFSATAKPGSYSECDLTLRDDNGVIDSAKLGSMNVTADATSGYEGSRIGKAEADDTGSFSTSVTVDAAHAGSYAILAVSDKANEAAATEVFSLNPNASESGATSQPASNETLVQNETSATTAATDNTTESQNQTGTNQNETGQAQVQVDEQQVGPGEPLAIQGKGFEPNTPVQVFINNLQITNVITNIQGSFNTVVIVPTTVNNGNAEVVVKTKQTNVVKNVDVVEEPKQNAGPSTIRFTSQSSNGGTTQIQGAPVTIFDTKTGELVHSDKTPFSVELDRGKYSVFYSDFKDFKFESASPGQWTVTPGGGSGLISVKEGRNATVTATYSQIPTPQPQPVEKSALVLRAKDTDGNPVQGMFVSVYNAETGKTIKQGFTEMRIPDLSPGAYPVFFANFGQLTFASATPGSWVQTPYGGAGLVVIPKQGAGGEVVVTATYDRATTPAQDEFQIKAPLDIHGQIFTITSNQTRPEGPFEMSGTMALKVDSEDPVKATLAAYLVSAREDSNENVNLESQKSRDHDTFQIVDLKPSVAAPIGPSSYIVTGTADLLLNGDMYSNDEPVQVMVRGGEVLKPTNVEIQFQGDDKYSAANRLETLYAVVTDGFQ